MKADRLEGLLQAERSRKGFSPEERAGLWKGIERSVGPLPGAGSAADPEAAPELPSRPGVNAGPLGSLKIGTLVAIAALGGAGLGAAAHARWAEPKVVFVERAVEPSVTGTPLRTPPPSAMLVAPAPNASSTTASVATANGHAEPAAAPSKALSHPREHAGAPPGPGPAGARAATDPALARERTLLDMARTALSRGDAASAIEALDTHAHDFPASQLAEEREVLAIQALVAANRLPEARRRGAAFRTTYPRSALLPIVEESTQ